MTNAFGPFNQRARHPRFYRLPNSSDPVVGSSKGISSVMPKTVDNEASPVIDWTYRARVIRVVDGDTIDVMLDAGFHSYRLERLRLYGINAPEMSTPAGPVAKQWTIDWLMAGDAFNVTTWPLSLTTHKTDMYGRYLAKVWRSNDGHFLSFDILQAGQAVLYP